MFGLAFVQQALLHEDVLEYFGFQKTSALGYKFGDTGLAPADVCPDLKKHRAREALFDAFATYADKAATLYDQIALAMLDPTALLVGECPDFTYEAAAAVVNSNVSGLFEDSAALNKYERLQSLLPAAMRQLIFCKGEQYVKHAFNVLTATDDDTSPVLETHAVVEDARAVIKAYASFLEVGEADSDYKAVSFVDLMLETFQEAYRFLHLHSTNLCISGPPKMLLPRLAVLSKRWWAHERLSDETRCFLTRVGLGVDQKKRLQDFAFDSSERAEKLLSECLLADYTMAMEVFDKYKPTLDLFAQLPDPDAEQHSYLAAVQPLVRNLEQLHASLLPYMASIQRHVSRRDIAVDPTLYKSLRKLQETYVKST